MGEGGREGIKNVGKGEKGLGRERGRERGGEGGREEGGRREGEGGREERERMYIRGNTNIPSALQLTVTVASAVSVWE